MRRKDRVPEDYQPVHVSIRVMQARLTVIGFSKAIVSFQIGQLSRAVDALRVTGVDHSQHIIAELQLYFALGLSFFALTAFVMSCEFKLEAACTHWSIVAGDLLMYLSLAHMLAGFFAPLATMPGMVVTTLPDHTSAFNILQSATLAAGGGAWFLATYIGPLVSLIRSPFQRGTNIALGIAYLLVLLMFCWLTAQAVRVAVVAGEKPGLFLSLLRELVQPLRW
jgi:hypothetical protein